MPAIVEGLRAGNASIDTEGTSNRILELTLAVSGQTKVPVMGGTVKLPLNSAIDVQIHLTYVKGARLTVIADGINILAGKPVELNDEMKVVSIDGTQVRR